jgi:Zn-dependent protease
VNVATPLVAAATCAGCGTEIAPALLSCPGCHRLVHASTLKDLAAQADAAARAGDTHAALVAWRSSLDLLPPASRQRQIVEQKIAALADAAHAATSAMPVPASGRWKWLAALGPAGLLLWKFKFLLVAILSKGKLLLLGLTKIGTLGSMFAAMALYWTQWGLWFAVGFVVSIYIHEMGHVAALRRYGIAASAPMFIPGLGALVRLKQSPSSPRENARIGLAGPVWGLGAAVAAAAAGAFGGGPMFFAIAHTGAWLNLFNLTPVWQLDGSRGFASLTRPHRLMATGALGAAWLLTGDGIVLLAALVAAGRCFGTTDEIQPDWGALGLFSFIALALALVFRLTQAYAGAA